MLRSFFEQFIVFRRFAPDFARVAASLNNKLKKNRPKYCGGLTAEELRAMHEFHQKLVSLPILTLPIARGKPTQGAEVCHVQAVCLLLQEQPDGTAKLAEC